MVAIVTQGKIAQLGNLSSRLVSVFAGLGVANQRLELEVERKLELPLIERLDGTRETRLKVSPGNPKKAALIDIGPVEQVEGLGYNVELSMFTDLEELQ